MKSYLEIKIRKKSLTQRFDVAMRSLPRDKIEKNLLNWFISYLSCRKQRVIIKGVHSDCRNIEAGVQQGSVLGLWLFLIYVNDLPVTISSRCFLFGNDCFLLEKVRSPSDCASILNHDFTSIPEWSSPGIFKRNLLKFLHFPSRSYVFYIGDRSASIFHTCLRLNFSAYIITFFRKIAVIPLPVVFARHLLKTWNVISYTARGLLLCVKSCLPPLHISLKIDGIVPQIRKKSIGC